MNLNRFPSQLEFQPTLANGHVGFTVFDDTVYVNGVYNGRKGLSHRARIPNWSMIRIAPEFGAKPDCRTEYRMNVRTATFEEEYWCGDRFRVDHRVYAHRYHNRAIINEFRVQRLNHTG